MPGITGALGSITIPPTGAAALAPKASAGPAAAVFVLAFFISLESLSCVTEFSTSISVAVLSHLPSAFLADIILNNAPSF